MGTLHIIAGAKAGLDNGQVVNVHSFGASGIPYTGLTTSASSASHTFDQSCRLVTLQPSVDTHIVLGTGAQTATTSHFMIPANVMFSFRLDYAVDAEIFVLAAKEA